MSKVLVTGGAGFIGSHLSNKLSDLGHIVFVVDDLSKGNKLNLKKKVNFYKEDIRIKTFDNLLKKLQPDFIYHLAAQSSLSKSFKNPKYDFQINLIATQRLIETASSIKAKKIVFASSAAVYGEQAKLPIGENAPKNPISIYGVSKLSAEYLLSINYQRNKMPYISLRYSNVYGENQDTSAEGGVVAIFIKSSLDGKAVHIFGDGNQTRDFIHVSDVINANLSILGKDLIGEFNISTSHQTTVNHLYALIQKIHKYKLRIKYENPQNQEVKKSALSYKKFNKVTGWRPAVDIESGLKITYEFFKKKQNPN